MLTTRMPLNEVLIDFYDRLKTISRGYASMDYEYADYQVGIGKNGYHDSWRGGGCFLEYCTPL